MKRPETNADHSPTSIAKKNGIANLQLSRPSACYLEIFATLFAY